MFIKKLRKKLVHPKVLSFWDLAIVQGAAVGIPIFIIGGALSEIYGPGTALVAIIMGNLINWALGLGIIEMTFSGRINAIENVRVFLGKYAGLASAIILLLSFLSWYAVQLKQTTIAISSYFGHYINMTQTGELLLSCGLGLFVALLGLGGLKCIQKLLFVAAPFFIIYAIYAVISRYQLISLAGTWGFSFSAVIIVIGAVLVGIVNLPTFFRYSKSKGDSYFALTVMTLLLIGFESFGIWAGINNTSNFLIYKSGQPLITFDSVITLVFILLGLVTTNLVNIYFASAGWEAVFPKKKIGSKEYLILGLAGTVYFSIVQFSKYIDSLIATTNTFIATLGIVLIATFLTSIIVKHRARPWERLLNNGCWLVGCLAAIAKQIIEEYQHPNLWIYTSTKSFTSGLIVSSMAYIVVIFIEEMYWSIKHLYSKKITNS